MIRRLLPVLVALVAAFVVAAPNAGAFLDLAYTPPVPFCDGTNGTPAHLTWQWHPLVERHPDGSFWCTYGHDHGIAPDAGNPNEFASRGISPDESISYLHATTSPTGVQENGTPNKHRSYKNIAWVGRWCDPSAPDALGLYDFTGQFHADANVGATPRFHSFHIKAMPLDCTTGNWGTLDFGGHLDYASLQSGGTVVNTGDNPGVGCPIGGDIRQANNPADGTQNHDVWYGSMSRPPNHNCFPNLLANETNGEYGFGPKVTLQNNLQMSSFGPVDPANPISLLFFNPRAGHTGTYIAADAMNGELDGFEPFVTKCAGCYNGQDTYRVDVDAYGTRHGLLDYNCQATSVDCIPVHVHFWAKLGWSPGHPIKFQALLFPQGNAFQYDADVPGPQGQAGYYVSDPT